jgi:hypothetical protein
MMNNSKRIWVVLGAVAVAACGNVDSTHLVFGQQQTVGLDITATAPEQGGTLSLGYKDKNIAVIPVAVNEGDTYRLLGSTNKLEGSANMANSPDENDAYSTIGQFELNTGQNGTASVGLGKFFATGLAAQKLADGFKAKLSKEPTE